MAPLGSAGSFLNAPLCVGTWHDGEQANTHLQSDLNFGLFKTILSSLDFIPLCFFKVMYRIVLKTTAPLKTKRQEVLLMLQQV